MVDAPSVGRDPVQSELHAAFVFGLRSSSPSRFSRARVGASARIGGQCV